MARITTERKEEIRAFVRRWDAYCKDHQKRNTKVSVYLLGAAVGIIKELLGE